MDVVPTGDGRQAEQRDEGPPERSEISYVIKIAAEKCDMTEQVHSDDGVDEHDEKKQAADVEKCRYGHGE